MTYPSVRNRSVDTEPTHDPQRVPAQAENCGVFSLPHEPSIETEGTSGCRVRNWTTPPIAVVPYRLAPPPPRTTSTLLIESRATRSQYTQPPKGSIRGISSTTTSARLAPLAPNPRMEAPWVPGLLVRLLERRNRVNPGTFFSTSSRAKAGVRATYSRENAKLSAGESSSCALIRVALTNTCCPLEPACTTI